MLFTLKWLNAKNKYISFLKDFPKDQTCSVMHGTTSQTYEPPQ